MIEIDFGICGSEKELEVKGHVSREVRKRNKKTNRIKPKKYVSEKGGKRRKRIFDACLRRRKNLLKKVTSARNNFLNHLIMKHIFGAGKIPIKGQAG